MTASVCIFGVDAMEPRLIAEWIESDSLPNLARLRARAAWGSVLNPPRFFSGASWPNFYTGHVPSRHDQYLRTTYDPLTCAHDPLRPRGDRVDAFWLRDGLREKRTAVITLPYFPSSKRFNGKHVFDCYSHALDHDPSVEIPAGLSGDFAVNADLEPVCCYTAESTPAGLGGLRDSLLRRIRQKREVACRVLGSEPWDLFVAGIDEAHCGGHQLWHVHDAAHPLHDPKLAERLGDPVKDLYVEIDKVLGSVLDLLDADATVLFISSHGMGPAFDGIPILDEILRRIEGLAPRVPGESHERLLRLARWRETWERLPQPLQRLLLPLRRQFGRTQLKQARGEEARGRRCFWLPTNDLYSGIRINLVGREANGLVQPGHDCERFIGELIDELHQLRDCRTGAPVVGGIVRGEDVDPEGYAGERPDLIIHWKQASFAAIESPQVGRIEATVNYGRTGDHSPEMQGVFFAAGPGIAAGRLAAPVRLEDFAPTIARRLGADLSDSDGSIIPELAVADGPHSHRSCIGSDVARSA